MDVDCSDIKQNIQEILQIPLQETLKASLQDYKIDTETKPMKITMSDGIEKDVDLRTYYNELRKLEEEGIEKKKEEDEKLRKKIDEINKELDIKNNEDQERRNKITRVRTIALSNLNIHPLMHSNDLTDRQKNQMIKECNHLLEILTDDEIIKKFNEIVCEEILTPKSDYTKYAIYHIQ